MKCRLTPWLPNDRQMGTEGHSTVGINSWKILGFQAVWPVLRIATILELQLLLPAASGTLLGQFPELGWASRRDSSDLAASRSRGQPCWGLNLTSRTV
jgi:hypothetical protein